MQLAGELFGVGVVLLLPLTLSVLSICGANSLARSYEDKDLLKYLMSLAIFGVILLIDFSAFWENEKHVEHLSPLRRELVWFFQPGPIKYVLGNVIVFAGLQASESVTMSLLSKVVSPRLAAGTFNSGLLATEIGTFGRALGDTYISVAGMLSMEWMLNLLFVPAFFMLTFCIVLIERHHKSLDI